MKQKFVSIGPPNMISSVRVRENCRKIIYVLANESDKQDRPRLMSRLIEAIIFEAYRRGIKDTPRQEFRLKNKKNNRGIYCNNVKLYVNENSTKGTIHGRKFNLVVRLR